jgi:hypothetical protein
MSDKQSAATRVTDKSKMWSPSTELKGYAVTAIILLLILTGAILTPDLLNYRYRALAIEAHEKSLPVFVLSKPDGVAPSVGTGTPPSRATAAPTSETMDQTGEANPISNADIFETYGKLVTMLLSFVAAIGVIAGYFIKKSFSELHEEIRDNVGREIATFEREKALVQEEMRTHVENVKGACGKVKELEAQLEKQLSEIKKHLELLNASIPSAVAKPSSGRSIDDDVAAVDSALAGEPVSKGDQNHG